MSGTIRLLGFYRRFAAISFLFCLLFILEVFEDAEISLLLVNFAISLEQF